MPNNRIERITLSDEALKRLVDRLDDMVAAAEEYHSTWEQLHDLYLNQYLCKPEVDEKLTPWPGAPLADDMEILSHRGWVNVATVTTQDKVLSQDVETRACAWMPVIAIHEAVFPTMLEFADKSLNQLVSPTHKMVVTRHEHPNVDAKRRAARRHQLWYPGGKGRPPSAGKLRFLSAGEVARSGGLSIPLTSESWNGPDPGTIYDHDAGDICEFLGWYLAEGWTYASGTIGIAQSEQANPDKCAHLKCLFGRLGFSWKQRDGTQFLVHARTIPSEFREVLRGLGLCDKKYIPTLFKDLSRRLLGRLLDGYMAGDGHTRAPRSHQNLIHRSASTTSRQLADDVQEIYQKLGLRATIAVRHRSGGGLIRGRQVNAVLPTYEVSINEKQFAKVDALKKRTVEYGRKAYCVTTPWHTIYCRRKGIASWTGNSNLVLPVGRVIQDGVLSQLHDAMLSNAPTMKVVGVEGGDLNAAEDLSLFYNDYVWKRVIPITTLGNDWNFLIALDGTACARARWDRSTYLKRDVQARIEPKTERVTTEVEGMPPIVDELITGYAEFFEEVVTEERWNRAQVDIVDMGNLFMSPATKNSLEWPDCPWYYQRSELTWDQLLHRKYNQGYDGIDKELHSKMGPQQIEDRERTIRDNEDLSEGSSEDTTPVLEFYCRMVLPTKYRSASGELRSQTTDDEAGLAEEVIVTYFPATQKVARIIPLWRAYPDGLRPHICNWYNKLPLSIYGQGVQAKARHINAMINSLANQGIDYGTLQNLPWYMYQPSMTDLMPDAHQLRPGQGVPVNDPRGVVFPRFQGDPNFWMGWIQQMQGFAERDGNVNDATTGIMPEKSANKTWRGMAAVLQQGQLAFGRLASLIVQGYEELFRRVHNQYKYRMTDDILARVTGSSTSFRQLRITRDVMQQDVDFQFVLNPNRLGDQQINAQMYQLMIAIPFIQQSPMAVRALAKQLYVSMGKKNFEEIWPEQMVPQVGTGAGPVMETTTTPQVEDEELGVRIQ